MASLVWKIWFFAKLLLTFKTLNLNPSLYKWLRTYFAMLKTIIIIIINNIDSSSISPFPRSLFFLRSSHSKIKNDDQTIINKIHYISSFLVNFKNLINLVLLMEYLRLFCMHYHIKIKETSSKKAKWKYDCELKQI